MAEVDVTVNGCVYRIACKDGEEGHLLHLSEHLNQHATELANTLGNVGEARLMLMAGLLVGDELSDALDKLEELSKQLAASKNMGAEAKTLEDSVTNAARRIEELAGRVKTA